ncbi:MAG: pyridoxal-phosphate dependent enzyme [Pedobacter sp.]|nr:pyridoxal-phosphate dependent enzyme [Pedobacter sp.]
MKHWPLFAAFPGLEAALQPEALAALPTPVEAIPALGAKAWIKRDDISHPVYGGNKIRKLEFVLADIRRKKSRHVITFGATGTNAGIAASMICRDAGLPCTIITFPQPETATVQQNRKWLQHFGAGLQARSSLWQAVLSFYLHPGRLRSDNYFLFAGCSNPVSTFGYLNAVFELREQIEAGLCPEPADIVVAVSSASTLAGLNLGVALAGLKSRVHGIRVAAEKLGPFAACTPAVVEKMQSDALRFMQTQGVHMPAFTLPAVNMDGTYFGSGYGEGTEKAAQAMRIMTQASGLPLESTYSGKAAAAFLDRLATATQPVLFWNTFNSRPLPQEQP